MSLVNNKPAYSQAEITKRQINGAVSWLGFIAALTLVNAVLSLSGSSTYFTAGIFFSQFMDGVISAMTESGIIEASTLTGAVILLSAAIPAVLFALFAWLIAKRKSRGSAIAALVLISADTLIFIILLIFLQSFDTSLIIDFAIHGLAIFSIARCVKILSAPETAEDAGTAETEGIPANGEDSAYPAETTAEENKETLAE